MALLSSTARKAATLAPPLPVHNSAFQQHRLVLRRKQFTLLGSAPGVGKSITARNLAVTTKCPALYFSADSDEYTVKTSVLGALTGEKLEKLEAQLSLESWDEYYAGILQQADHVEWSFNPSIDTDFIALRMRAYEEVYGEYPHLVVVDNIGDLVLDEGDEYGQLREICRELRRMARQAESHILGLVHLKGAYEDGTKEVGLSALLGNIGKTSETVLGLYWDQPDSVVMTVPKARGAKRGVSFPMHINYETGRCESFFNA